MAIQASRASPPSPPSCPSPPSPPPLRPRRRLCRRLSPWAGVACTRRSRAMSTRRGSCARRCRPATAAARSSCAPPTSRSPRARRRPRSRLPRPSQLRSSQLEVGAGGSSRDEAGAGWVAGATRGGVVTASPRLSRAFPRPDFVHAWYRVEPVANVVYCYRARRRTGLYNYRANDARPRACAHTGTQPPHRGCVGAGGARWPLGGLKSVVYLTRTRFI